MTSPQTKPRPTLWPLALFAFILLPLCFIGYGSDNDTYSMLSAGRSTWIDHLPYSSRNPGYWTIEAIFFALSSVGGFIATNLATLTIGILCLWRFLVIAARMGLRLPHLAAASLVVTPVFAIACSSTIDYVWSLLGIILFAELLIADRFLLAIFPAAFAFLTRGANGVVIAGAITAAVLTELLNERKVSIQTTKLILVGVGAALLGAPQYVLSWWQANHSFDFLEPSIGPAAMWTPKMWVGRFVYKMIYLFGPLALIVAAWATYTKRSASASLPTPQPQQYRRKSLPIFSGIILANILLFLRYPIEISYLIPAAFFLMLLVGKFVIGDRRLYAIALIAAIFSMNLVVPRLAEPNIPGQSTSARIHPGLGTGILIDDLQLRLLLRHCSDYDCYHAVIGK